jgi:ubiquinol-cytochrome c reductase cytochrome c subunit
VYLRDCAVCHGADARGSDRGPSLDEAGPALVDYYVSTGRMPLEDPGDKPQRHTPAYPPETIAGLVRYVTSLTGATSPAIPHVDIASADLAEGAHQFQLNCAACHAATGVGGALLERAAPKVTSATPRQAAEAIRTGPGQMPGFGRAALSDAQVRDTVAYVRYLAHPEDRGGNPLWHLGPLAEGAAVAVLGLGPILLAIRWIGTRR